MWLSWVCMYLVVVVVRMCSFIKLPTVESPSQGDSEEGHLLSAAPPNRDGQVAVQ